MKYCTHCGKELFDEAVICPGCGCAVENGGVKAYALTPDVEGAYRKLSEYERISGIVWLVIGIIQCISLVGIICGIWNIVVSVQRLNYSKEINVRSTGVYKTFYDSLSSIIIMLVLNIVFGAVIGVVGAIVDLLVRNYVVENKNIFDR